MSEITEIREQAKAIIDSIMNDTVDGKRNHMRIRQLFNQVKNPEHWKKMTRMVSTNNPIYAAEVMAAIIFYTGGCELNIGFDNTYHLLGKGYYFYVGA